jgi:hypothetical protein
MGDGGEKEKEDGRKGKEGKGRGREIHPRWDEKERRRE